ncbi:hypothetical protein [Shouchella lehensis]|uniref:Uncharacterized protein n=1 Tax=Shouchella lehensis TaxID=300825 RepID=A0A4Y7WLC4_9BACI|nr:hypothetical protein [Shouchella lehensis]MBG9783149.1 hypothetical protein [Shouchella lehensis]TES49486.1 hypothetical protein E2L03_08435 [Shouchella lehensis]
MIIENEKNVIANFSFSLKFDSPIILGLYENGMKKIWNLYLGKDVEYAESISSGTVRFDKNQYTILNNKLEILLLKDLNYIDSLIDKCDRILHNVQLLVQKIRVDLNVLPDELDEIYYMLSMTSFNWFIPLEEYRKIFIQFFGQNKGNQLYLSFATPNCMPHFTLLELKLLECTKLLMEDKYIDLEFFKDMYGCLKEFTLEPSILEKDEGVIEELRLLKEKFGSVAAIDKRIMSIKNSREKSIQNKYYAYFDVHQSFKNGEIDKNIAKELIHFARMIGFVNHEEEKRHILQMQVQRQLYKFTRKKGLDYKNLKIENII